MSVCLSGDGRVLQATQVLKVDDEREFIVVRDEYKGGEIRLSLRKIEVRSRPTLAASQCAQLHQACPPGCI